MNTGRENAPLSLTIGSLAEAALVNLETIRFYQRKGMMREPERARGSIRRYGEADLARVRLLNLRSAWDSAWTRLPSYSCWTTERIAARPAVLQNSNW